MRKHETENSLPDVRSNSENYLNTRKEHMKTKMSRCSPEDVWFHTFGDLKESVCPCCKVNILHRDPKDLAVLRDRMDPKDRIDYFDPEGPSANNSTKPSKDWIKGHIIPDKEKRWITNVLINMRPMCIDCNNGDRRPKYKSNFHYSEYIGGIKQGEADILFDNLVKELTNIQNDPTIIECETEGCSNTKKARSDFCQVCKNKQEREFKKKEKVFFDLVRGIETSIFKLQQHIQTSSEEKKDKYFIAIEKLQMSFSNLLVPPVRTDEDTIEIIVLEKVNKGTFSLRSEATMEIEDIKTFYIPNIHSKEKLQSYFADENFKTILYKSLYERKPNKLDVARVIKKLYENKMVCSDAKKNIWKFTANSYSFDGTAFLKKVLEIELRNIYSVLKIELLEQCRKSEGADRSKLEYQEKKCSNVISALETIRFQNSIIKICKDIFTENV